MKSIKETISSSPEKLKQDRVSRTLSVLESVSQQEVQKLIVKYRSLRNEYAKLLDMGDNTTIDIAVKLQNIDPEKVMCDITNTAMELVKNAKLIIIRVAIHNSMFPDNKLEGLSAEDIEGFEDAIYLK